MTGAKPAKNASENASAEGTLAAQLWTFRYDLEKNVPGTLKKIKNLGINYVEGFDAPYIVGNPDEFKSQLDVAGLKMFALHWNNLNDWRKDPTVIIETAKKLGAHYTGIAWLKVSKADTVTLEVVNEAADGILSLRLIKTHKTLCAKLRLSLALAGENPRILPCEGFYS
jgi:sugar phosphate isomerase/epimerase